MELVPGREPKAITYQQFQDYTPEKLEMYENNVFFTEKERIRMLTLLLTNVGIKTMLKNLPSESRKELVEVVEEIEIEQKYLKVVEHVVSNFRQLKMNYDYQFDKQNQIVYIYCHLLDTNTIWLYSHIYDEETGEFKEKEKFHAFASAEVLRRLLNK
ncbi:hypothetical protein [Fredinandcohnia quinoae]|uniref:Uncharacterized protein n=1 Tax=Fredinandcohnia quinoae TaxID=2918902 RepID=A0AAW5E3I5_9BACI|nr:hypothetical protein [Fredinandcohnia sp. SECRCQ15]MCH1626114.1 hypothetical protein [Fredinandcohnia sp. SECRCQ15]